LSKEDRAFAEAMRDFFTSEIPAEIRDRLSRGGQLTKEDTVTSQRIMNAHGLAVPHWPTEWGGRDWTPIQRHLWSEEMRLAFVPPPLAFNTQMIGPVIAQFGEEEMDLQPGPDRPGGEEAAGHLDAPDRHADARDLDPSDSAHRRKLRSK
jgi:alkylation response protein AidB-like acyl-CoA dehydrogenase